MARDYCKKCQYPLATCVCDHLSLIDSPSKIILLQHPREVKHAKNTGRLVQLAMPTTEVLVGEEPQDFADLITRVNRSPNKFALVYPSPQSRSIESWSTTNKLTAEYLIFIDSTWRKAYKMFMQNPWLLTVQHWHFERPPESQYEIRKTAINHGRSTLEAVSYCLQTLHQTDTKGLFVLFEKMQMNHHRPKKNN